MDVMAYALAQYPIDIAVIALEGEGGMRSCEHIRKWFKEIPIIWVSDDESYEIGRAHV